MIPVLFDKSDANYNTQGLGALSDCLECTVHQEINGVYELTLTYPVDGVHSEGIEKDNIVLCKPEPLKDPEPFIIYGIAKNINGVLVVSARHISYMLSYVPVRPFTAEDVSSALSGLVSHAMVSCGFTTWTDKKTTGAFVSEVPNSFRSLLGGVDGSILDVYHGEYEFVGKTIKLWNKRGRKITSPAIVYGKNLVDYKQEEKIGDVVTGVVPYWKGTRTVPEGKGSRTEDVVVYYNGVVQGDYASNYAQPHTVTMDFSSKIKKGGDNKDAVPTQEELKAVAEEYVSKNLDGKPVVSITITPLMLSQSEENKDVVAEMWMLGDTVPVHFAQLGVDTTAEIVAYEYNVLNDTFSSLTLGSVKSNLGDSIANIQTQISGSITQSDINNSIALNNKILSGADGGYVVTRYQDGHPAEMFFTDNPDLNKAKKCLRLNQMGIGGSTTGINGPFRSSMTIDGEIVADVITSGTLRSIKIEGNEIKGGTVTATTITGSTLTGDKISGSKISGSVIEGCAVTAHGLEVFGDDGIGQPYVDFHADRSIDWSSRILEQSPGYLLAYNTIANASDRRLKKNISNIDSRYSKLVDMVSPKEYRFKNGDAVLNLGFIAQDISEAMDKLGIVDKPLVIQSVPTAKNSYFALDYNGLIAVLWLKVQELEKEINDLKGGKQ